MKTNTSRVMHMAHILRKNHKSKITNHKWRDYVSLAWYFERFRQWLFDGVVAFTYLKKDNSIRDARGTLNPLLIPDEDKPKGMENGKLKMENYAIVNYYDLDKKGWRSFDIRLFVGYVTIYELKEKRSKRENYADSFNLLKK